MFVCLFVLCTKFCPFYLFRPPPHESQSKRPPHQPFPPAGGGGGGHPSPPLAGTRGYPYAQDPGSRCTPSSTPSYSSPSPHLVHPGGGSIYAHANHVYRDTHFQVNINSPWNITRSLPSVSKLYVLCFI